VGKMLPLLDRLSLCLAPRHRVRFWLAMSGLPLALGLLAVMASFLPALGIGHDHCLVHDHDHPHLCPVHVGGAPGIVVVFVAAMICFRTLHAIFGFIRGLRLSRNTSLVLSEGAERQDGAFIFSSDEPQAFVLNAFRPRVHVSRGLLALGRDIVEPVLAHERVHARCRDLLWRYLCPLLAIGHFPSVTGAIRRRLDAAQELAADAEAAATLPQGRLKLAEALVALARVTRTQAPGLAFTHGDLQTRVHALLEDGRAHSMWPARLVVVIGLLLPVVIAIFHHTIHHSLETLLGALS
jgi:Zn-dependent protease with chaperone function